MNNQLKEVDLKHLYLVLNIVLEVLMFRALEVYFTAGR